MASNACWQVKEDKDSTLTLAFNKVALTGDLDEGCFEAEMEFNLNQSESKTGQKKHQSSTLWSSAQIPPQTQSEVFMCGYELKVVAEIYYVNKIES